MAGLKKFLVVIVLLTTKDEAFSCPTRSHKASKNPCASLLSDSTSNSHHTSGSSISCNSASTSSHDLSSISSRLKNNLTLPSKSTFTPATILPVPISFTPPSPHVYSDNHLELLNILTKILSSSPSNVDVSKSQVPPTNQLTLHNIPGSNIVRDPVNISNPHSIYSSHASPSGTGPCSSGTSPCLPNGLVSTLIVTPSPSLEFLAPVLNASSLNISGDNSERWNTLQKPLSDVPSLANLPPNMPKIIPLSQLCAQFMPTLNNNSVPVSDLILQNKSYSKPSSDAIDCSSSMLPGLRPFDSFSNAIPKVPEAVPESPLKTFIIPTTESILTPKPTSIPTTELAPESALSSNSSTACGRRNPAKKNLFHKRLLPTKAPKFSHAPPPRLGLSPPCVKTTLNAPSVPGVGIKPHNTSLGCGTSSGSIGSSPLPKLNTPPSILTSIPSLNPGISSGYNPAFMQLLVNRILSNPNSLQPSLSYLRPSLNITPVFPPTQNILHMPTLNRPTCDFNTNLFNVSSDKSSVSTRAPGSSTTTTPSTSLCHNPDFTNMLCKLLLSSLSTSKTYFPPCTSPINVSSTSSFNSTSVSTV